MRYTKVAILCVLCGMAGATLQAALSQSTASTLAVEAEQLALRLRQNVMEYIVMKGKLPEKTFNPFMQEGMFPGLALVCNKEDNACLDQKFMYTGSCNVEKCTLNVAHLKTKPSTPHPFDWVDYMISMQIPAKGNIKLVKRLCFYNGKLGQQVCNFLQAEGWAIKQFGK